MFERKVTPLGLGHNIGHSVGWVERSETQQLIGVGFRSSTQPTKNSDGLKYDQGPHLQRADGQLYAQTRDVVLSPTMGPSAGLDSALDAMIQNRFGHLFFAAPPAGHIKYIS